MATSNRGAEGREALVLVPSEAALGASLEGLRDWDLRPERTVSLLRSLSVFLEAEGDTAGSDEGGGSAADEARFGELSLAGLEYLCETWAGLLGPYGIRAKQEVRERFAAAEAQSYVSIAQVMQHLDADLLRRDGIRRDMCDAVRAAEHRGPRRGGLRLHRTRPALNQDRTASLWLRRRIRCMLIAAARSSDHREPRCRQSAPPARFRQITTQEGDSTAAAMNFAC